MESFQTCTKCSIPKAPDNFRNETTGRLLKNCLTCRSRDRVVRAKRKRSNIQAEMDSEDEIQAAYRRNSQETQSQKRLRRDANALRREQRAENLSRRRELAPQLSPLPPLLRRQAEHPLPNQLCPPPSSDDLLRRLYSLHEGAHPFPSEFLPNGHPLADLGYAAMSEEDWSRVYNWMIKLDERHKYFCTICKEL
jgi:hypothetical protein